MPPALFCSKPWREDPAIQLVLVQTALLYPPFGDRDRPSVLKLSREICAGGHTAMDLDRKKIGDLISTLRRQRGMTQKELADQLHVSDRTVSKWERGLSYT